MQKTFKITISGQVQGVGFRPYVHGLALEFKLKGTVSNNEEGVIIFTTGEGSNSHEFFNKLIKFPPPVSRIKNSSIQEVEFREFDNFRIIPSQAKGQLNLSLTPDFAICEECRHDISNPSNNRYNYPFTTCVNCGPRWAVTKTFPFERENTSIDNFPMCEDCLDEYTNPTNRRFHSQTNTCPTCGVKLYLTDRLGVDLNIDNSDLFKTVADLLKHGSIIAIKNTSGFLLCCNAEEEESIKKLRERKRRPNKPFAVLYPSIKHLKKELFLNERQIYSLQSVERPINIISLKNYKGNIALKQIAPGLNQLGVMLPYSGILQLLANELDFPIVATSGNIHGSPIICDNEDALEKLNSIADFFVLHNLEIIHPQDDSVVKFSYKKKQEAIFRRSRGYAPNYFSIEIDSNQKILALGAHLKSSVAFYPNAFLYVSQYLGNLDNYDVYERFCGTTENFMNIFKQKPDAILIDAHPTYQSSLFGKELAEKVGSKIFEIQHHKAHFASVLGEHKLFDLKEKVLGVVWDGTGYGDDGNIWGGEFFIFENGQMERKVHFNYFDWLAGDKMSTEPRISLLSLLHINQQGILEDKFTQEESNIYNTLKQSNTLKTSSVGRLFDAVASGLNICDFNSYEGEAAILLENTIEDFDVSSCKAYCDLDEKGNIPTQTLVKNLMDDFRNNPKEVVIQNFLFTLSSLILKIASKYEIKHIAFSGGVFQNTTLIDMINILFQDQYKLYFNSELSPNDENVSFGQIMYYLHCLNIEN